MLLLVLLDNDDNYIYFFGFAVSTILLSLVTRLTVVANVQAITLLNFAQFKFLSDYLKKILRITTNCTMQLSSSCQL